MGCTKPCSYPLPCTTTHSHLLPSTPTHFYSFSTHCHLFSALSHPLPLKFSSLLLILNPTPAMCRLSPISSPYPNTHTQFNPSPTIPTHIQSLYFTCLRALRTCVLICVSRAHVPMQFISMHFSLEMVLLNYIPPTFTHVRLPERKVKKVHTHLSFRHPLLQGY